MIYDAWGNVTYDYNEELSSLGMLEALNIASINNETMKGREIEKLSKINIKGKLYLFSCKGGTDKSRNSVAGRFAKLINGKPVRAVVNGSVYYRSATQLFSYKPLTKEKGAYWADFKYIKNKGKFTMVKKSIGRKWYL